MCLPHLFSIFYKGDKNIHQQISRFSKIKAMEKKNNMYV